MRRLVAHSLPLGRRSIANSHRRLHSLRVEFGLFVHVDHVDFAYTRRFTAANAKIEPGAILVLVESAVAIGLRADIEFGVDDVIGGESVWITTKARLVLII